LALHRLSDFTVPIERDGTSKDDRGEDEVYVSLMLEVRMLVCLVCALISPWWKFVKDSSPEARVRT